MVALEDDRGSDSFAALGPEVAILGEGAGAEKRAALGTAPTPLPSGSTVAAGGTADAVAVVITVAYPN